MTSHKAERKRPTRGKTKDRSEERNLETLSLQKTVTASSGVSPHLWGSRSYTRD